MFISKQFRMIDIRSECADELVWDNDCCGSDFDEASYCDLCWLMCGI